MQAEQLVEYLRQEKRCTLEEAASVVELLGGEPPAEEQATTPQRKHQALTVWEAQFGQRTRNFGLSRSEFQSLLEKLHTGDQVLFEHIFLRHFPDCLQFLTRHQAVPHPVAYDVTMDTLLTFRRQLLEGRIEYGNLRYLFTRMAVLAARKVRDKQARLRPLEAAGEAPDPTGSEHIDEESMQLFGRAWQRLGDECRRLLQAFYYDNQSWKAIAVMWELSEDNVRKKGQRCRESLQTLVKGLL